MRTNNILWYRNGLYGQYGYAGPYFTQKNWYSLNSGILSLVSTFGKLVFGMMQMPDVWKTVPPENTFFVKAVGKAVDRARAIMAAKMVPVNQPDVRSVSIGPEPQAFLLFPVPYFRLRNPWAKQWCGYALRAISEAMRHPNNLDSLQLNQAFVGTVSIYTNLIYAELAIELLGVKPAEIAAAGGIGGFTLTDTHYAAYNPDGVFSLVERVDTGAPNNFLLSQEDLEPIAEGVPAPLLAPLLEDWPMPYQPPADKSDPQANSQLNAPPATVTSTPQATATVAASTVPTANVPPPGP